MSAAPPRRAWPWICAAAALAVHAACLFHPFVGEDIGAVAESDFYSDWSNLRHLATRQYFRGTTEASYRPVTTLAWFLERGLFGNRAWGWHLAGVLVHALNAVLALRLFERVGGGGAALFGALCFAGHSLAVEAVGGVSFQEDVLSTLFILSAVLALLRHLETGGRATLAAASAFTLLACFAKETGLALLALAPLAAWAAGTPFREDARARGRLLRGLGAVLLACLLYAPVRFWLMDLPFEYEPRRRALVHFWAGFALPLSYYLQRLVLPAGWLGFEMATVFDFDRTNLLLRSLFVIAVLLTALWGLRRSRAFAFGALWSAAGLAPVMNLVWIHRPLGERFAYLPLVGFSWLFGLALARARSHAGERAALALAALSLTCAYGTTLRQISCYRDEIAYLECPNPTWGKNDVRLGLARAYRVRGDTEKAWGLIREAMRDIRWNKTGILVEAARILRRKGLVDGALNEARQAAESCPFDLAVCHPAYLVYGQLLLEKGRDAEALAAYERASSLNPFSADAHYGMALALLRRGEKEAAREHLARARRLRPSGPFPETPGGPS